VAYIQCLERGYFSIIVNARSLAYIEGEMKFRRNQDRTYKRPPTSSNVGQKEYLKVGIALVILCGIFTAVCHQYLGSGIHELKTNNDSSLSFLQSLFSSRSFVGTSSSNMFSSIRYVALAVLPFFASSFADKFEQDCASFATKQKFENTTIYFSQYAAAGSGVSVQGMFGPSSQKVSTDICRVGAYTATTNRSGINFETWLPRNWTGRFISHGNGGISGSIDYGNLGYSSSNGFAAVSANGVSKISLSEKI
jgi:hypothetical protein